MGSSCKSGKSNGSIGPSGSGALRVSGAATGAALRIDCAMKSRQSRAGRPPPFTPRKGVLSSLPTQTPTTKSPAKPMNSASRLSWLVPVLPYAGIDRRAARAVPLLTVAPNRSSNMRCMRPLKARGPENSHSIQPCSSRLKAWGSTGHWLLATPA